MNEPLYQACLYLFELISIVILNKVMTFNNLDFFKNIFVSFLICRLHLPVAWKALSILNIDCLNGVKQVLCYLVLKTWFWKLKVKFQLTGWECNVCGFKVLFREPLLSNGKICLIHHFNVNILKSQCNISMSL